MVRIRTVAIVIAGVSALACGQPPKVAVLCPASGPDRTVGASVDLGVRMALDAAADQGLLPGDFVALHVDTASSRRRAIAEYRRMVGVERAQLVVGGVTAFEAEGLVPVVDRERVVCLSPSAPASEAARRSRYFYRLYSRDEVEGFTAARYLRQQAGVRRLVVLTDGSLFTRSIETEFRQHFTLLLGGRIEASIRIGEEDWRRRAGDLVRAHDPDGVYVVGHADRILEALEVLRTSGYGGVRCTNSHVYVAEVLGQAGDLLDGIVFPIAPADVAAVRDPLLDFARRFEEMHGRTPDAYAAQGYDAMRVAIRAVLTSAGPHPEEVRRVLEVDLGAFGGVMGTIGFGILADPDRRPTMHTVRSGRVVPVERLRRLQRETLEGELGLRLGVEPASARRTRAEGASRS